MQIVASFERLAEIYRFTILGNTIRAISGFTVNMDKTIFVILTYVMSCVAAIQGSNTMEEDTAARGMSK